MSHSKRWRDSLPTSFKSPFMAQGDLGFFSAHRKTYGSFFLAVNSYSGYIHVSKISNTKLATLVEAVAKMVKVNKFSCTAMFHHHHHHHVIIIFFFKKKDKHFADVHTLLFDGEAALATKKARDLVMEKYHLKLYADPGAKRNMAERGIRGKKAFCFCMILHHLPPPPL